MNDIRLRKKIPATMVSQHPDHASVPYWKRDEGSKRRRYGVEQHNNAASSLRTSEPNPAFISTAEETKELYISFSELGATEYKWDWEGKLVDESVMERLLSNYFEYFKKNPLGVEKYLTFRLPNPRVQTEFRIGRSFMNLLSAAAMAKAFGLPDTPLFEVILPMTTNAEEMMDIHEAFYELATLKHKLYKMDEIPLKNLKVIPLFEDIDSIADSDKIIEKYISLYKKRFKRKPQHLRPYIARSDPALNSGLIPTILAAKIALSKYAALEKKTGIPMYPIIGVAALPFRGGLTPPGVMDFINEYKGVRTTLLQSAFRYDYPLEEAKLAVKKLEKFLPKNKAQNVSREDEKVLREIMVTFESFYKPTIEGLAGVINKVASNLPKRRERVQHTGLFGYSRGVGKVKLPRAIGFTAALYSLGVPPELIGTGRGLKSVSNYQLTIINEYFKNIRKDLTRAGRYLNKSNLKLLSKKYPAFKKVEEDVEGIEKYLGIVLGPETIEEKAHLNETNKIYSKLIKGEDMKDLIERAALLRKSLG